ncbi:hypothetical protein LINPERPRIM_LOCUS18961 [Linum perenne]
MAGYGNTYKGYTTYSTPQANGWSEPSSYPSDHVCKPVIIDAEGRKRPIIALTHSQTAEPYRSSQTVHHQHHAHSPIPSENKHGHSVQPAIVEHYRVEQKLHQTSEPIYNRLQKVAENITKVQNEVSTPKFGAFGASQSHHSPKHVGFIDGHHEDKEWQRSNGHAHQNDRYEDYYQKPAISSEPTMFTNDGGWGRPTQTTWASQPDSNIAGATNNISTAIGYLKEAVKPSVINPQPYSHQRTEPIGYLKEAVKPSVNNPLPYSHQRAETPYSEPPYNNGWGKRGGESVRSAPTDPSGHYAMAAPRYNEPEYRKPIDSNGSARRYGNFKFSPRTYA